MSEEKKKEAAAFFFPFPQPRDMAVTPGRPILMNLDI